MWLRGCIDDLTLLNSEGLRVNLCQLGIKRRISLEKGDPVPFSRKKHRGWSGCGVAGGRAVGERRVRLGLRRFGCPGVIVARVVRAGGRGVGERRERLRRLARAVVGPLRCAGTRRIGARAAKMHTV